VKHRLPDVQLLAGNVATYEGARDLIALGIDGLKVGYRPRVHLHHPRGDRSGRSRRSPPSWNPPAPPKAPEFGDRRRRHQIIPATSPRPSPQALPWS